MAGNNIAHRKPSARFPNGAWQVTFRAASGDTRRKSFSTKRAAEQFRATVVADKARGDFLDPSKSKASFAEIAERWSATLDSNRKEKTVHVYRSDLRNHVLPTFGRRAIGSITYADVDAWVRDMEATGAAAGTIRNAFKVLKLVLGYAIKDGRIRVNPATGVTLPKPNAVEMLFLSPAEIVALADEITPRWRPLLFFAAYTGLRAGEIAALRVRDIDWSAGTVTVIRTLADLQGRLVETEPKTRAARRTVGIPAFVMAMLRAHVGNTPRLDGYLFGTAANAPMRHGNFYRRHFRPAVTRLVARGQDPTNTRPAFRAELAGLRFHDLRHTFASLLVATGVHPKEMSEQLGHADVSITLNRYSHVMPHLGARIAEKLDAAYANVKAEPNAGNVVNLR